MNRIIYILIMILLFPLVNNISFSQWNKVNEHFELTRAKNTKILNYSTFAKDSNLVIIDEFGEINEYNINSGDLNKTCNCIKDSTFEYAKVLEDNVTVVLARKYWDSTSYTPSKFYQFELFLLNKNSCEFITNAKIPLDSTALIMGLYGAGVNISNYYLGIVDIALKNQTLIVKLNKYFKREVNYGKPYYNEYETGEKFIFDYNNEQILYKEYKRADKIVYSKHFDNDNVKYAEINYYRSFYNSLGVQMSSISFNVINFLDNKDTLRTIYTSGQNSSSSNSMAGGYWSKSEGLFQDVHQVLLSNTDNILYFRMKDSLVEFNLNTGKFSTLYKGTKFNQNLYTSKFSNLIFGLSNNHINLYDLENFNSLETYNFNKNLFNSKFDENTSILYSIASDSILLKYELTDKISSFPKYGFKISDSVSYTDKIVILKPYTIIKDCEFVWYINGNIYTTKETEFRHIFDIPGIYDIKLIINAPNGKTYEYNKDRIIEIKEKLIADFDYNIDDKNPFLVNFINKSSGNNLEYSWKINDNNFKSKDTFFDFRIKGDFKATLVITDGIRSEVLTKYINLQSNNFEVKDGIIQKQFPNILDNNNYTQIFKSDSSFIFVNRFSTRKEGGSDLYPTMAENFGFYFYDLTMKYRTSNGVCGTVNQGSSYKNESKFNQISINQFILKKTDCSFSFDPYNIYIFQAKTILINGILQSKPFFADYLNNSNISFYNNNIDRIYSMNQTSNNKFKIYSADNDYNIINTLEYYPNKFTTFSKIQSDKILVMRIESQNSVINIYDKDLKSEIQQNINTKILFKDSINTIWKGIGFFDDENIYLYGYILENDNKYALVGKLNYKNNSFESKVIYSRESITNLHNLNDKYMVVNGNSRSNQGYMILDNNLNIIKDVRYSNLSGTLRNMWIDKDNIYMFSGDLNFAYDKLDDYILLSNNKKNEAVLNTNFLIFPNPSSDKISVDLGEISGVGVADLVIYDILGNEIMSFPNYTNKSEIDISTIPIGIYTIQIQTPTGSVSQRLLVNR